MSKPNEHKELKTFFQYGTFNGKFISGNAEKISIEFPEPFEETPKVFLQIKVPSYGDNALYSAFLKEATTAGISVMVNRVYENPTAHSGVLPGYDYSLDWLAIGE